MKKMLMTVLLVCAAALVLAGGRREEGGDRSLEKIKEREFLFSVLMILSLQWVSATITTTSSGMT